MMHPFFVVLCPAMGRTLYLTVRKRGSYRLSHNKRRYFRGDQWFQYHVDQRTRQSLRAQEAAFIQEHEMDTNEQLLRYVRQQAFSLGFTPNEREIIGGKYISFRFGGWQRAVTAARLQQPRRNPPLTKSKLYKNEYQRQAKLFREERRQKYGGAAGKECETRIQTPTAVSPKTGLAADKERDTTDPFC